jgi:hypothetical protein
VRDPDYDYQDGYIDLLNRRMADYSEFDFPDDKASFQALRFLSLMMREGMEKSDQTWIQDQLMDIESAGNDGHGEEKRGRVLSGQRRSLSADAPPTLAPPHPSSAMIPADSPFHPDNEAGYQAWRAAKLRTTRHGARTSSSRCATRNS